MPIITSDIVVIGAGTTGAAAAVFLARAGLKVVLLDKGCFGAEASGRCAGGVRQQNRHDQDRPLAMQVHAIWDEILSNWGFNLEYGQGGKYISDWIVSGKQSTILKPFSWHRFNKRQRSD